jgi:isoleucyl-tRNA synthetase
VKQYGADILRLWVSSEDYRNDVRIGMDMVKQIADSYRRIRNTFKFIMGNIGDFNESMSVPYEELSDIDKWILHKLAVLSERVIEHYEKFEFHMVYRRILNFCAVELSSVYFDISKDILYVEALDAKRRRANQTVLHELYKCLVRLVAPILAFTAEEVWKFAGNTDSVHTQTYYVPDAKFLNNAVEETIERVVDVKKDVLKALEEMRREKSIKSSLEADVTIFVADEKLRGLLAAMGDEFKRFLQVAAVNLVSTKEARLVQYDFCAVAAAKTTGKKCIRCWNYYETLGSDHDHPELCRRCTAVVKTLK